MDDRYAINAAKTEIREGYRLGDVQRILSSYLVGFADLSDGFPSFGRDESRIVLEERLKQLFARYNVQLVTGFHVHQHRGRPSIRLWLA